MNLRNNTELLDRLAAEYALGTLRGASRRRLETLAQGDAGIQRALDTWRTRIEAIAELAPGQTPPESVWLNIEAQLGLKLHRARISQPTIHVEIDSPRLDPERWRVERWFSSKTKNRIGRQLSNLNFWRGWALVTTVAAVLALGLALRPLLPTANQTETSRIAYVAVLHDQSSQSAMLVTWDDAHSTMTLRKLSDYPLRDNQALQLWGLPSQGHPVSLGLVKAGASYSVKLPERPQNYPVLAVSLEPGGGSPNPEGPTGPVIYSGKLLPTT